MKKLLLLVTLLVSVGLLSGCTKCSQNEMGTEQGQEAVMEESTDNTMGADGEEGEMMGEEPIEPGVEDEAGTDEELVEDEDPAADADAEGEEM